LLVSTSDTATFTVPQSAFSDPQGGTPSIDVRYQAGAADSVLQALPPFLQFDTSTLQLTASPQYADRGVYNLRVLASSRYGNWQGSVAVPLTVTVSLSWQDFFSALYSAIGFALSGLSCLTAALVYRATLRNVVSVKGWLRVDGLPVQDGSLDGHTVCRHVATGSEIRCRDASRVVITPLRDGAAAHRGVKDAASQASGLMKLRPTYFQLQALKQDERPQAVGCAARPLVPWATVTYRRDETICIEWSRTMAAELLIDGELQMDDAFLVEVSASGWWRSGFLLEAYIFTVGDVMTRFKAPPPPSPPITTLQLGAAASQLTSSPHTMAATNQQDNMTDTPTHRASTSVHPSHPVAENTPILLHGSVDVPADGKQWSRRGEEHDSEMVIHLQTDEALTTRPPSAASTVVEHRHFEL
jgi:hypothetical protein